MNTKASALSTNAAPSKGLTALLDNIESVFQGKSDVVRLVATALLARGHILLEDVPGVGKTTLAHATARSLNAVFQRVQFTSDLLPSDILGVSIFRQEQGDFTFKPGPIFANFILADEINRTTPRTQSALLEAMAEGRVSIDNQTHQLPSPFMVLATQNPLEYHGTYPLPESQLDRFLIRTSIGYPGPEVERQLLLTRKAGEPVSSLQSVLSLEELKEMQQQVDRVRLEDSLADYILEVVHATRRSSALRTGVSTRGALAMARAVRAHAMVHGRTYVIPDDIATLIVPVLAHRISLAGASGALGGNRTEAETIIEEIAHNIEMPV